MESSASSLALYFSHCPPSCHRRCRFEKYTLSLQVALAEKLSSMTMPAPRSLGLSRTLSNSSADGLSGGIEQRRPCDDPELWRAALEGVEDFASTMFAAVSMPGFVPGETAAALVLRAIADSQDSALNPAGDLILRAPIRGHSSLNSIASDRSDLPDGLRMTDGASALSVTENPALEVSKAAAAAAAASLHGAVHRFSPRSLMRDIVRSFNLQLLQLVRGRDY
jgi:hypothetical protein